MNLLIKDYLAFSCTFFFTQNMDNQHFNYNVTDNCQELADKGYIAGCMAMAEIPDYPLELLESDIFLDAYLQGVKDVLREKISQMTIEQHWLDGIRD